MKLSLSQIKRDKRLTPRTKIDPDTAEDYSQCFAQLPPMVVFKTPDESKYLLVDGWHRYRAAEILALESVEVETRYGIFDEALEFALLANLRHGRPLTRKEKRKVIEQFLKLHPERSNSWIAADLGTSKTTVGEVRTKLETTCQIDTLKILIGRDGKERPRTIEQPKLKEREAEVEEADEVETEAETPPAPVRPALGPYELNEVHQADCIVALMGLPEESLDLVFADPPYNIGVKYGRQVDDKKPPDDYYNWCMQWFVGVYRALKKGGAFYVMHYPETCARWKQQLDGLLTFRHWISWVYPSNIGHSANNWRRSHRAILYYIKGDRPAYFEGDADPQPYKNPGDVRVALKGKSGTTPYDWWEYNLVKNVSKGKTEWPNQLPVALVQRIILTSAPAGGVVCDPFMGSGTTAIASIQSGRDWIGFDVESAACKITEERIRDVHR